MTYKNKKAAGGNHAAIKCRCCNSIIPFSPCQEFVLTTIRMYSDKGVKRSIFIKGCWDKPFTTREIEDSLNLLNKNGFIKFFPKSNGLGRPAIWITTV